MNEKNELVIVSNVVPAALDFNFDEIDKQLDGRLDEYRTLIVTEDSLKGAKHAQSELASLRSDLEKFRKEKKKEAEAPIKDFEAKIKKLYAKVEEVEKPLKLAINDYDDRVREEKRKFAQQLIDEAIATYELNDKYAARMILKPEFMNLNGTKKSVKEDVTNQAMMLQTQQKAEEDRINMVKAAVDSENTRLKVKLDADLYLSMLQNDMDLNLILGKIKEQADKIYEQENKPEEVAPDVTYRFQDQSQAVNIVNNDAMTNGSVNVMPQVDIIPIVPNTPSVPIIPVDNNTTEIEDDSPFSIPSPTMPPVFEVVFKVTGDFDTLKTLNNYLKSSPTLIVETLSQKKIG